MTTSPGFWAMCAAIIGPLLLTWLTGRQRRLEKAQDYARQDLVAARLEANVVRARVQVEEVARVANATAMDAKDASRAVGVKLDVIHTLVNSQLSTAGWSTPGPPVLRRVNRSITSNVCCTSASSFLSAPSTT